MQAAPALIIIDMQNCMADARAGQRNNPQAEDRIAQLLAAWRSMGARVIHVRHISRSATSMFAPGQAGAAFQPRFVPLAAEHVVEKNVPDAFVHSGLERWLHVRGITQLVLAGVSTNNSVESSARSAGNLGFQTQVVADATFAYAQTDYAGNARTADEVHAMALANLQADYAQIVTCEAVIAALAQAA
ncbi:cysteine hydrolase family protein [Massilia sp. CF038]|uniref:cysteine hydrolase family protein n=1 Tax=Massilia sp. CF038 TaxID=1881045 RepID=UPI000914C651|nr:cysteine hydrolase family protein [Massilia sp. CF038]SHH50954.1 Nicotinamidase-related amidase [Massilia sp. CF038]